MAWRVHVLEYVNRGFFGHAELTGHSCVMDSPVNSAEVTAQVRERAHRIATPAAITALSLRRRHVKLGATAAQVTLVSGS